ncbi:MAG: hydroxyethylthiazole kinase, partial [Bacteroidales bacterium]
MVNLKNQIWEDFVAIREQNPLVLNVSNYVVMNTIANCMLAIGASPIFLVAPDEASELVEKCDSVVINSGTPDSFWLDIAKKTIRSNVKNKKPLVLDPVGVGFSKYKTKVVKDIIDQIQPTVIRGNAGEVLELSGCKGDLVRGVSSLVDAEKAIDALSEFSHKSDCTLSASGSIDVIICGDRMVQIGNGSKLASKVSGMGCVASALT